MVEETTGVSPRPVEGTVMQRFLEIKMQLNTIAPEEQEDAISSFWTMLQECEGKANDGNDAVLRHWVEGWYRQWNRITGDTKVPRWVAVHNAE